MEHDPGQQNHRNDRPRDRPRIRRPPDVDLVRAGWKAHGQSGPPAIRRRRLLVDVDHPVRISKESEDQGGGLRTLNVDLPFKRSPTDNSRGAALGHEGGLASSKQDHRLAEILPPQRSVLHDIDQQRVARKRLHHPLAGRDGICGHSESGIGYESQRGKAT